MHTSQPSDNSTEKVTRVRIALVQLECHPALAVDHDDWLSEPFICKGGGPLRRLSEQQFPAADALRKLCHDEYLNWCKHRLEQICQWLKDRFPKGSDEQMRWPDMPDVIVFPECSVPLEHLYILRDFASDTGAVVFAGTHTFPVDAKMKPEVAANIYYQLGIINHDATDTPTEPDPRSLPPLVEGTSDAGISTGASAVIDSDTQAELHRILRKNSEGGIPSLSVMPVITPLDSEAHGDKRLRMVRLRAKAVLSPFERTEAGIGDQLESPEVISLTLPVRRHRKTQETINVLPLVCAEALHLVRVRPKGSYQLAVVVSLNENFDYFEPILKLHRHQQIPVAYCNDAKYGDSTVCFPREERQSDAFYGPNREGRLPPGDAILVADVTLGVNASVRQVSYTQQFYSLVALAAVVQDDARLPACHIARGLDQLRKSMQRLRFKVPEENDPKPWDPFRSAEGARSALRTLRRNYEPTLLQKFNLTHLEKLMDPPCNAYPNVWDIHAWDCLIRRHDYYPSLALLESDLAANIFTECNTWFERRELNPDQAKVIAEIRAECQARMQVLYRLLAQLERSKSDAKTKAKERLYHQLGALVERFGATSGWLLPIEMKAADAQQEEPQANAAGQNEPDGPAGRGAPIIPKPGEWNFGEPLTHNSTNRYKIVRPQSKDGIVGRVVETGIGYVSNHVVDVFEEPLDPYYKLCIPTTRSEIAVPIWEPACSDTSKKGLSGPRLIGVLNLESNQFGAFLPVLLGGLQAAVAALAPDLLIHEAATDDKKVSGWHPVVHGWGSMHIIDRFCYAVASSTQEGREEPSLTCSIWNFDEVKRVLYVRGTSGFDYEYLTQMTLGMDSYSGKVVSEYLDQDAMPGPRVHRVDVLSAAEQDDRSDQVHWYDFRRKQKIDRMGMSKLIVAPLLRYPGRGDKLKVFGTLNLYFYRHDEAFSSASPKKDPSLVFTDAVVLRITELVTQLVEDFYELRERVVPATLAGRLAESWQHGEPSFEIIKKTLAECLEGDGVTLLAIDRNENQGQEPDFKAVATTGMGFQGIWINPKISLYKIEEVFDGITGTAFAGMTRFLLGRGGRTIRKLNVADGKENVKVILDPATGKATDATFTPSYRTCEALPPAEYWKHRYLGASFGEFKYESKTVALGALRLIRGASSRPFVRHEEILLKNLAAQVSPLFEAWHQDGNQRAQLVTWLRKSNGTGEPSLPRLPRGDLLGVPWDERFEQAGIDRLVYRSRGPVAWNRQSVHGLLQDLLFVFRRDHAVLADVRFTVTGREGELLLRPFMVVARDSQEPQEERHSRDFSVRHTNNGWRAIRTGKPVLFEPDNSFTKIHAESDKVKSGICWPFRFFAHGHCVDGVFSIDFELPRKDLNWQSIHAKFIALVARQLAWMSATNNNNLKEPNLPPIELEINPQELMEWFVRELQKLIPDKEELLGLTFDSVKLFNVPISGPPMLAWSTKSTNDVTKPEPIAQWTTERHDFGDSPFVAHRDDRPDSEWILYGIEFEKAVPWEQWCEHWERSQRFRFPLYLGATKVGWIEGTVQFIDVKSIWNQEAGKEPMRKPGAASKKGDHFQCLSDIFGDISALWCAVANGNAPLARSHPLWTVEANTGFEKGDGDKWFYWPIGYSWPWPEPIGPDPETGKAV